VLRPVTGAHFVDMRWLRKWTVPIQYYIAAKGPGAPFDRGPRVNLTHKEKPKNKMTVFPAAAWEFPFWPWPGPHHHAFVGPTKCCRRCKLPRPARSIIYFRTDAGTDRTRLPPHTVSQETCSHQGQMPTIYNRQRPPWVRMMGRKRTAVQRSVARRPGLLGWKLGTVCDRARPLGGYGAAAMGAEVRGLQGQTGAARIPSRRGSRRGLEAGPGSHHQGDSSTRWQVR